MKKRILGLCVTVAMLFIPLTFSSVEEINPNTHGSGVASYVFDPGW